MYYVDGGGDGRRSIRVGSLAGQTDILVAEVREQTRADYHPSGYVLFVTGGERYSQRLDVKSMRTVGERSLALHNDAGHPIGPSVSIADNGVMLYRIGGRFEAQRLVWRDRSGKQLLPEYEVGGVEPEITGDGRTAVAVRLLPRTMTCGLSIGARGGFPLHLRPRH